MAVAETFQSQMTVSPALRGLLIAFVWLTFLANGLIISEPAPADLLMMAFVGVIPLFGMARFTNAHGVLLSIWFLIVALGLIPSGGNEIFGESSRHMLITLYLGVFSVVLAGFVAKDPARHLPVIWNGYLWAAVIAGIAGIIGYYDLIPGSYDLFTRYWRARGTFKDANVFAPFLVPAVIFCLHNVLTMKFRYSVLQFGLMALLSFAILLSFSRGGWMVLVLATAIYLCFFFFRSATQLQRVKMVGVFLLSAIMLAGIVVTALQSSKVKLLWEHRITLNTTFEQGDRTRFYGHQKGAKLVLENPLGIGALYFSKFYHHEQPHNVYLSMYLSSGWIGGTIYLILIIATLIVGFLVLLKRREWMHYHVIAYATFIGLTILGYFIDTDHWRQYYILVGVIWGAYVAVYQSERKA